MTCVRALVVLIALALLAGCESAEHDMYHQPRDNPQAPAPLFSNGASARPPPPRSIVAAQGAVAGTSGGRLGRLRADDAAQPGNPPPMTAALLQRGRERYEIFCAPCHGRSGDGDGMVVERGFPAPPSFHDDRWRNAPDQELYRVISDGTGIMYPFSDRIAPPDRWAIVAYMRALQLSRHAPAAQLQRNDIDQLDRSAAGVRSR